jgi:hypothetical protein
LHDTDSPDQSSTSARDAVAELDHRLREAERSALARHRARLATEEETNKRRASRVVEPAPVPEALEAAVVRRLRQDIERLAHYQAAVEASRVWRAAQWARRALGRKW